jgi:Flp pilus assembly protein TadD
MVWLAGAGLLLLMQDQPMCTPTSQPNGLCQNQVSIPAPQAPETGTPKNLVQVYLEDGGRPASRPTIVYSGCREDSPAGQCTATITLKGFRETRVPVNTRGQTVVTMIRVGLEGDAGQQNEVSVRQLAVPSGAHKAYAKGSAEAGLGNWPEAETQFREAVKGAPGFALAWDELGAALERQGKVSEAREAYQKAVGANPRFARPYVHLAGLAVVARNWKEAALFSDQALRLRPEHFPRAYLYDATACFNLGDFVRAEQSARSAIAADPGHAFPVAEYLLGVALLQQQKAEGAEHLRLYLQQEPNGPFVGAAQTRLATLR